MTAILLATIYWLAVAVLWPFFGEVSLLLSGIFLLIAITLEFLR